MSLIPGSRLGPYEIVSSLGAGGMGEVYRARDARLDRDVALKVLPDLFARDPERLARFDREAKTLAALNHPHIAHVYGLEQSVWSIPVTGSGMNLDFGTPTKLFGGIRIAPGTNAASRPLAVSRDGSRFYIPQGLEQPEQNLIHVMTRRTAARAQ